MSSNICFPPCFLKDRAGQVKKTRHALLYAGLGCLILSCQTPAQKKTQQAVEPPAIPTETAEPVLAENSRGYHAESALSARPDWVEAGAGSAGVKGTHYFQAKGQGNTIREASDAAENDIKRQIASLVLAKMNMRAETSESGGRTLSVDTKKGARETKEEQAEQRYLEEWIQSATSFTGAKKEDYFWERVKTGDIETIHYWARYSITDQEIAALRERIKTKDSVAGKEEAEFVALGERLKAVLSALDSLSFVEQEGAYRTRYEELLAIHAQWKELGTQRQNPGYSAQSAEIEAAIKYYDPTNSKKQIAQETERLKIQRDITRNESSLWEAQSNRPQEEAARTMTVAAGPGRIHLEALITNSGFLAFLDNDGKPDLLSRHKEPEKPAVNVSWLEAARYCNWRSSRAGLEPYYTINGKNVQTNPGKNGYRLPARDEINMALERGVLKQDDLAVMGVLSADSSSAYCYDRRSRSLRALDSALPTSAIGFMVVRNDGK